MYTVGPDKFPLQTVIPLKNIEIYLRGAERRKNPFFLPYYHKIDSF